MRFKVQLVVCAEDGQEDTVHELTVLDKPCQRLEHLSTVRSKYTASSTHSVGAWQVAETPRQTGGAIAVRST